MLTGRDLRTGVVRFVTRPELVVEVDIALPGRDVDMLFGVISPDRSPRVGWERREIEGKKREEK